VIIRKVPALSAVSSVEKQVWGKCISKIYFVVIVIIINGKLSALSSVGCIIGCGSRGFEVLTVDQQKYANIAGSLYKLRGGNILAWAMVWCSCMQLGVESIFSL